MSDIKQENQQDIVENKETEEQQKAPDTAVVDDEPMYFSDDALLGDTEEKEEQKPEEAQAQQPDTDKKEETEGQESEEKEEEKILSLTQAEFDARIQERLDRESVTKQRLKLEKEQAIQERDSLLERLKRIEEESEKLGFDEIKDIQTPTQTNNASDPEAHTKELRAKIESSLSEQDLLEFNNNASTLLNKGLITNDMVLLANNTPDGHKLLVEATKNPDLLNKLSTAAIEAGNQELKNRGTGMTYGMQLYGNIAHELRIQKMQQEMQKSFHVSSIPPQAQTRIDNLPGVSPASIQVQAETGVGNPVYETGDRKFFGS